MQSNTVDKYSVLKVNFEQMHKQRLSVFRKEKQARASHKEATSQHRWKWGKKGVEDSGKARHLSKFQKPR